MGAMLAKLVPIRDWIYLALFLCGAALLGYWHHSTVVKIRQQDALRAAMQSEAARAQAAATIINLNQEHAANVAAIARAYVKRDQADRLQLSDDAERLREYDTYRRSRPVLESPSGGPAAGAAPAGGTPGDAERATRLEQVALQLAAAGRAADSALTTCEQERNSLTGK